MLWELVTPKQWSLILLQKSGLLLAIAARVWAELPMLDKFFGKLLMVNNCAYIYADRNDLNHNNQQLNEDNQNVCVPPFLDMCFLVACMLDHMEWFFFSERNTLHDFRYPQIGVILIFWILSEKNTSANNISWSAEQEINVCKMCHMRHCKPCLWH